MVVSTIDTSYDLANYVMENGINPFTNNKKQEEIGPDHYQLELKINNKKAIIYLCSHNERKSHFPASYSRLEITVEETKQENGKIEKTLKKFIEFGLYGIVDTHTGVGDSANAQLLYEELKEEIFLSIFYDAAIEIMSNNNV